MKRIVYKLVPPELLDSFPEINLSNYGDDEVRALNNWGIQLVTFQAPAAEEVVQGLSVINWQEAGRLMEAAIAANHAGHSTGTTNWAAHVIRAMQKPAAEEAPQQDCETVAQTFTGLPMRKLRDLLKANWQINGVCFQRTEDDGTVRRGAVTTGGMVLWWNQQLATHVEAPQQEPDRTGMTYYKNDACKAKDANASDCICWTPKQQPATHGEPMTTAAILTDDEREAIARPYRLADGNLDGTKYNAVDPSLFEAIEAAVFAKLSASPQPTPELVQAAKALVDRWNSPAWGGSVENLKHTGEYITALQSALKGAT